MDQLNLIEQYSSTKDKLNAVSPSFCLAKWFQVTLHLQNGHNHSCHHPNTHQAKIEEIQKNPAALHNSAFKKKIRHFMLTGVRPKECEYCWKIEDTEGMHFSDRHIKSNDDWSAPFFEEAIKAGSEKDINPTYLEVSFSNSCNFKCAYCLPHISSSWMKELKVHGDYKTHSKHHSLVLLEKSGKMPMTDTAENPYVGAFWQWWPSLYPDLKYLRLTGGEPFLVPDTYRLLDYVESHANKELTLAINTNLGVEQKLIDKAIYSIAKIQRSKNVKHIEIYTSLDTWGKGAEYIRYGLDLNLFLKNLHQILEQLPEVKVTVMCTYNLFSISGFREFLIFILELKNKYKVQGKDYDSRIVLDISYLKDPQFMCANLADNNLLAKMKADLDFMLINSPNRQSDDQIGFTQFEINKMQRLYSWASTPLSPLYIKLQLRDLYLFFSEYDKRRSTDFKSVFPDYSALYAEGLLLAEDRGVDS